MVMLAQAVCWLVFGAEAVGGGNAVYLHPAVFEARGLSAEARQARVEATVAAIKACGFDTVYPYANNSSGHTYFPCVAAGEAEGNLDVLGAIARSARAAGLRVVPVVCVLVSGHDAPAGVLLRHPEWGLRNAKGEALGWISPGVPEARGWIVSVLRELAGHVPCDGLLLDYLRFPNERVMFPAGAEGASDGQAQREAALTALLGEIHEGLGGGERGLPLGIYSWGPQVARGHLVSQCWPAWIAAGWLDFVNVSGYCYRDNYGQEFLKVFEQRLAEARELVQGSGRAIPLSFALGVHTSHGAVPALREVDWYLDTAARLGYAGVAAFSWAGLRALVGEDFARSPFLRDWRRRSAVAALPDPAMVIRMRVDFGKDTGRTLGTLFEARSEDGAVIAGAGFAGGYNTYYRAARHTLLFHVRPPGAETAPVLSRMERPSDSRLHYLFEKQGSVYATDRAGSSYLLRGREWFKTSEEALPGFDVGARHIAVAPNRVLVRGRDALDFPRGAGTTGSCYYAQGWLFFHVAVANSAARETQLHACRWDPEQEARVRRDAAVILPLPVPGEFPYSYGQDGDAVIVGSNSGGVYRFSGGAWETLRGADPKVSFQLYTMINYEDRLLMGHYPTGELYEITPEGLAHLPGWPPRPEGAGPHAREAQTLAFYAGRLYCGVWPWGEVWARDHAGWKWVHRFFRAPEIASGVVAPFDAAMEQLGEKVNNLWGQRITSMIPFEDRLILATSNKNGAPAETRIPELAGVLEDYGAVWELRVPGALAAPIFWTGGPTDFEFRIGEEYIAVLQDGRLLGRAAYAGEMPKLEKFRWGGGLYGACSGTILETEAVAAD
jgi:hypothetical protein